MEQSDVQLLMDVLLPVLNLRRLSTESTQKITRMHSSRVHTACSSSRPGGSPPGTPQEQPPRPDTPLGAGTPPNQTPWEQAPPDQTPGSRHPPGPDPVGAGTCPPGPDPPGAGTPQTRPPGSRHPPPL